MSLAYRIPRAGERVRFWETDRLTGNRRQVEAVVHNVETMRDRPHLTVRIDTSENLSTPVREMEILASLEAVIWEEMTERQRGALLALDFGATSHDAAGDLTFHRGLLQCGGGLRLTARGKRVAAYGRAL